MRAWVLSLVLLAAGPGVARRGAAETGPEDDTQGVRVEGVPLNPGAGTRDPSVAGSTVRRAELARPGLDAADVLRTAVGVSVTESGGLGAAATTSIRGATAAETPVYLAGVRINDDVGGAADLSTLPLWLVERVEIYRGNPPFEADRYGIGGAIFFEPLRPHDTRAAAGVSAGSYGSHGGFAYATAGDQERSLLLGVSLEGATNDYAFDPNPSAGRGRTERLENADATLFDLWLLGRTEVGRGRVELTVNRFSREQGAPRLAVQSTKEARQSLERHLASVAGRAPLGRSAELELRTTALLVNTTLDDPHEPVELLSSLGAAGHRLEQRGERVEQELGTSFEAGERTRARIALVGSSERLRRYEQAEVRGVPPVLDARRLTGRIAGSAERDLTYWLSLRALLALEQHATDAGSSTSSVALEPVGRLAALVERGVFSAFAGVGHYARTPTLGELYGTALVAHGNRALVPEKGETVDAGVRVSHALPSERGPLYASLAGYARRSQDLITYVRTSQSYVTPRNVRVAEVAGLELESGFGFARYFTTHVGVTVADFRDQTPNNPLVNELLPYHSRFIFAPALDAATPKLGQYLSRVTCGAELVYQSSRYADFAGTEVIPEQASLDVNATLDFLDGSLFLRGRVTDVFDAERYDVVGFPLPGRSVFVSLEVHTGPL